MFFSTYSVFDGLPVFKLQLNLTDYWAAELEDIFWKCFILRSVDAVTTWWREHVWRIWWPVVWWYLWFSGFFIEIYSQGCWLWVFNGHSEFRFGQHFWLAKFYVWPTDKVNPGLSGPTLIRTERAGQWQSGMAKITTWVAAAAPPRQSQPLAYWPSDTLAVLMRVGPLGPGSTLSVWL